MEWKKFLCPRCKVISNVIPKARDDQPTEMPEMPEMPEFGGDSRWDMAIFETKWFHYHQDHWNESITCPNCSTTHTYWNYG